jgi:hypothetical protein
LARIRSDKPEAYQSETLAEISLAAERTFKGMATIADDLGRLADKPAQINGELWSMRGGHTKDDLESELAEMVKAGLVCRYTGCDGKRYLHLVKWDQHQKIDRPSKSRLPRCPVHLSEKDYCGRHDGPCPPGSHGANPGESSTLHEDSRVFHEDSMQDLGSRTVDLGPGTVEQRADGREREVPPAAPVDDFELNDFLRRWAHSTHPGLDLEFETSQFRRHYQSTGAARKSWPAAWQKWIADSHKRMAQQQSRASPTLRNDPDAQLANALRRIDAREERMNDTPRNGIARPLHQVSLPSAGD